jgi:TatD DNase family protein
MIDSHCHLADDAFKDDLDAVVARAQAAGLTSALCILSADEPDEVARAPLVKRAWPAVEFAAAVHPHRAKPYADRPADAAAATRAAADAARAVALGEIGLDYHYDFSPRDVQREVFAAQIALALELDKPVVIHTREAADDTLAVLREAGRGQIRAVMHCFTGSVDDARRALDLGCYISLAGILTFPKAGTLRDVAVFVPEDRVLVETDAPFLAPVPHRGQRNEPAWVTETLNVLATLRSQASAEMRARVTANFAAFIGRRVDTPAKPMV